MPRPKKPGSGEPKTRSRHGCWPCKHRKIKCGEEKPGCLNCERNGEKCDYSIKLNWLGRNKKGGSPGDNMLGAGSFMIPPDSGSSRKSSRGQDGTPQASPSRLSFQGSAQSTPGYATSPGDPRESREREDFSQSRQLSNGSDGHSTELPTMRDFNSTTFNRLRESSAGSYPSPTDSTSDSPPKLPLPTFKYHPSSQPQATSNPEMRPPYSNQQHYPTESVESPRDSGIPAEPRSKRMRFSSANETSDIYSTSQGLQANSYNPAASFSNSFRPPPVPHQPSFGSTYTPATSAGSDEYQRSATKRSPLPIDVSNDRRVSVQSLLSETSPVDSGSEPPFAGRGSIASSMSSEKTVYGLDRGRPDRDIPDNDDQNALSDRTPTASSFPLENGSDAGADDCVSAFGFGLDVPYDEQEHQTYYSNPVKVLIPRAFEPLPPELRDEPMNLLYFHHFLDHTARILVPHDCSENPFKTILPKMALEDPILLHLLLSYSACHRARLLSHPEPIKRISIWMEDVFPALSNALKPPGQISDSYLAAAIMLASLEIIAPKSFEVEVSWQQHLNIARQMIIFRGQGKPVHRRETVAYFLTRWFAYLDVLGSLSGRKNDQPLFHGNYWANDSDDESGFQIDCLLGFTSKCVSILAKVAELARSCDSERIDSDGNVHADWKPSVETLEKAQELKKALEHARMHRYRGCPHRRKSTNQGDNESYAVELVTTNDAFHWAGLIHLHRRVLGKPSEDPEVQLYVREIVTAFYKIRKGGSAEGCMLFPMFTAGCDAREQSQRETIMDRLKSVEGSGMFQVRQARELMEKVWKTERSWETFSGEFIG